MSNWYPKATKTHFIDHAMAYFNKRKRKIYVKLAVWIRIIRTILQENRPRRLCPAVPGPSSSHVTPVGRSAQFPLCCTRPDCWVLSSVKVKIRINR